MEVVNSNRKFKVYWMYNNSVLPDFALGTGMCNEDTKAQMERVPLKKQIEMWNSFPNSSPITEHGDIDRDRTWCFICEGDKIIAEACVVRFHKDTDDRDKARKYSLAKALHTLYPELTDKKARTLFWEAYLGRINSPVPAMRAVRGGVIPVKVGNKITPLKDVNI